MQLIKEVWFAKFQPFLKTPVFLTLGTTLNSKEQDFCNGTKLKAVSLKASITTKIYCSKLCRPPPLHSCGYMEVRKTHKFRSK